MAYRVFRDGYEVSGRDARYPYRGGGLDVSASRKRDCTVRGDYRQTVRAFLAAFRAPERGRAENVQIPGQLLYAAGRNRAGVCAGGGAVPAGIRAVSEETQLRFRRA